MNHRLFLPIAALVSSACASKNPEPAASSSAPAALATSSGGATWVGNFQQQQQRTSQGIGPAKTNRAHGTVRLTPKPSDNARTLVNISVTVVEAAGATMAWGIYPGRCGSGSGMALPLIPSSAIPSLEANRSGAATLNTDVAFQMPTSGVYHLNVYWGTRTSDLADVATCANLRMENAG